MRALRKLAWVEVKLFLREPTRLVGMVSQPLIYLLIVGQGIASGLTLNGYVEYARSHPMFELRPRGDERSTPAQA